MKSTIWMPLYISDYLSDTMFLDAPGHGVYLMFLFTYWKTGPLPLDMEKLKKAARSEDEKLIRDILDNYWIEGPDGYYNERAKAEKEKAIDKREKASRNGRRGGRPRKASGSAGPALEEVIDYAGQISAESNPKEFHAYHTRHNWVYKGVEIENWRVMFDYWEGRHQANKEEKENKVSATAPFKGDEKEWEDVGDGAVEDLLGAVGIKAKGENG